MKKREHEIVETFRNLSERNKQMVLEAAEKRKAELENDRQFHENYYIRQAMRDRKLRDRSRLMEGARDNNLATVVKAIYITALEAESLTDEGLLLAEDMVDSWIKESGGASKILNKVGNNSYLLSRITQIVEDAAEEEVDDILDDTEKEVKDDDAEKFNKDGDTSKEDAALAAKEFISNASKEELAKFMKDIKGAAQDRNTVIKSEKDIEKANNDIIKSKEKADKANNKLDTIKDDENDISNDSKSDDDSKNDDIDDLDSELNNIDSSSDETTGKEKELSDDSNDDDIDVDVDDLEIKNDDEENDSDDDPLGDDFGLDDLDDELNDTDDSSNNNDDDIDLDDDDEEDITIDGDEESDDVEDADNESHGKVFDELDKEDDVKKAIELIRNRVADAEQKFIKNNAEDKKKIDDLLSKISQNVKTVEDMDEKNDENGKEIASESVRMDKRRIDAIRNNRPLTIFECMTRKYSASVIKDSRAKEAYLNEFGSIDTELVVESAKIMYAFLETLNTLQLEKVDSKYIAKVLNNM